MSKFKVGDKVRVIDASGNFVYSNGAVLEIIEIVSEILVRAEGMGLKPQSFNNSRLELVTSCVTAATKFILEPGELIIPPVTDTHFEDALRYSLGSVDKHCLHTWREVLLLTSTVTECSKCGVLRE